MLHSCWGRRQIRHGWIRWRAPRPKRGDLGRFATSTSRCIALVLLLQSIRRLPNVSTTSTAPTSAKGFSPRAGGKGRYSYVYTNTSPPSPQACLWRRERGRCEMDGSVAHRAGGVSATVTVSLSAPVSDAENANSNPPMCHGAVGELVRILFTRNTASICHMRDWSPYSE